MFFLTVGSLLVFSFCDFDYFMSFMLWFRWVWFDLWFGGFLLQFDFSWVLAVVVVVIWFWLGFGSGAWLEVMSLKSSGHGDLEGEFGGQPWSTVWRGLKQREDERETRATLDILGFKTRTKNWAFFILIY